MSKKVFAILLILLFLLSILSVIINACCLPIIQPKELKESVTVTETVPETIPETTFLETVTETTEAEISYFDTIDERIRFNVEDGMFPESWYDEPSNAKVESSKPENIEASRVLAIKALKKYPDEFLFEYLDKAYFLNFLGFFGVEYGGTNSSRLKTIYVTNNGINQGDANYKIEQNIHSELSSIPYKENINLFPKVEWEKINPNNFIYIYSNGVEALISGEASITFDPLLNEEGFLYEYAKSTLSNDYSSIVENLFLNDGTFWEIYEKYPIIKAKTNLAIAFYNKLNPTFTLEYFKKISKE